MIFPSAVLLSAYACWPGPSAADLEQCETARIWPDGSRRGEAPQCAGKAASDRNRCGLSLAAISKAAALSGLCPGQL